MGNKLTQDKNKEDQSKFYLMYNLVTRNHFEFLYVVGKGGFGKVKINLEIIHRYGE